ncbi:MAG: MBL fold metallo-hydrolase [Oscillospiraceae bacterium]|nr:MBL fold metallo-hydrolase [Oscillospiraceae bacterium]
MRKKLKIIFLYLSLLIIFIVFLFFGLRIKWFNNILDYFNIITIQENKYQDTDLVITAINVDHGDSLLINSKDNKNNRHFALVDTGTARHSQKVIKCLNKNKIKKLDYIIISHMHSDHMGGLSEVLKEVDVDEIVLPNYFKVKSQLIRSNKVRKLIKNKNIKIKNIKPDTKILIGSAEFNVLYPIVKEKQKLPKDLNNSSIVGILKYNEFKMMFTGDATTEIEEKIIKNYKQNKVRCNILKLAHHGSQTSSSLDFLSYIKPKYAVVSSGYDRDILYPHQDIKNRLLKLKINYYNTRTNGDIIIAVDQKNYKIYTEFNK